MPAASRNYKTGAVYITLALFLLLSVLVDTMPRFTLGDSASYLTTRIGGHMPDDRSWLYGLLASGLISLTRDLTTVAILQIVVCWVSAVLLSVTIADHFRIGWWYVILAVAALFLNPLSFFWARDFMTDTLAAAAFGALVALLFAARGIVATVLGVFVLGFCICALRSVYMPPLLLAFCCIGAICLWRALWSTRRWDGNAAYHGRAAARYFAIAVSVLLATEGCALVNSIVLRRGAISTNYATDRFLVSAWSPLMAPAVAELGLPATVTDGMTPLTYDNRLMSAFSPAGIVERLKDYFGSYEAAAPTYRRLLISAVLDNPVGFVSLMLRSWSDYINPHRILLYQREMRLTGATGWGTPDELTPDVIARLEHWGVWQAVSPQLPQASSWGLRYYAHLSGYWVLLVSIHATFAVFFYVILPRRNRSNEVLAVQLFAFAYMAMLAMTTNETVTRYLIPMDVPLMITVGALLGKRSQIAADSLALSDPAGPARSGAAAR